MTGTAHSYSEWIPIMATITATGTLDDLIIEELNHGLECGGSISSSTCWRSQFTVETQNPVAVNA